MNVYYVRGGFRLLELKDELKSAIPLGEEGIKGQSKTSCPF